MNVRRAVLTGAAFLLLVAVAAEAAQAQVQGSTATLRWDAASGPVFAYAVFEDRNGSGFPPVPNEVVAAGQQTYVVEGAPGDVVRVRVEAWGSGFDTSGPPSPASEPIVFAGSENVVVNGGFESGVDPGAWATLRPGSQSLGGWTVLGHSIDYIGHVLPAASGGRSVDLSGDQVGGIAQLLQTQPGRRYRVTFEMQANPLGPNVNYALQVSAGATTRTVSAGPPWEQKEFEFVANATTTELRFESHVPGYYGPLIDDVEARAVDSPGATPGPSVVANGGFEQGSDPGGWQLLGPGSPVLDGWSILAESVDYIGTAFPAAGGGRSLELTGNRAGGITQLVPTQPGVEYRVTFALAANPWGPAGDFLMRASAGDDAHFFVAEHGGGDVSWKTVSFDFLAEAFQTNLEFQSLATMSYYGPVVDSIEVRPRQ